MNYPLENLDPERFQQVCQALLMKEHPSAQCFPVGQGDGGRDAVVFHFDRDSSKFVVFQVKFVRDPAKERNIGSRLKSLIEGEVPKVKELVSRGAVAYCLITNLPGTGSLDSGTIDNIQATLKRLIPIPATCWWRDDINRRLDQAWDVKWAYPELMTGPDLIRAVLERGLTADRDRRESALRAFVRHQYETDRKVRFKQVELQNELLDLFVDVPIMPREPHEPSTDFAIQQVLSRIPREAMTPRSELDPQFVIHAHEADPRLRDQSVGATRLLVNSATQVLMPHVVIEGAPGQGKSTIVQFLCQLHRSSLLNDRAALERIPKDLHPTSLRLPIKLDLRDLAAWLTKRNPFVADDTVPPGRWSKSLESFLAALVSHQSGGTDFTTDDLLAVARVTALLLVFDGLDEIADVSLRNEVVDHIVKGIQRLRANTASLQTIVTSRPAAFANSPGMPRETHLHLNLLALPRELIDDYAERWIRARRLGEREANELRRVLKAKLQLPHLRDLARNPMQLAILLSLMHTRGVSLPDKRTALYDSYVQLFFDRESEKSPAVRDHRDLLIDIHRYLAWYLHTQSETGQAAGSITEERLHFVLRDYLSKEGHDPSLTTLLFNSMVERVVALVSRVQGTFEFEVQPLREYFAARFLYDTAPYSPPGNERRGTKPDRFDALARNFYWSNVTRFFAGCFSKGELPALVDRLQDLARSDDFRHTSQPLHLAVSLLSDWVFAQHPRSVQGIVSLLFKSGQLRYLTTSPEVASRGSGEAAFSLAPKCGREELIAECFDLLKTFPTPEYAIEVLHLVKGHCEPRELAKRWLAEVALVPREKQMQWLSYGATMRALPYVPLDTFQTKFGTDWTDIAAVRAVYEGRWLKLLESSNGWTNALIEASLDGELDLSFAFGLDCPVDLLLNALHPWPYVLAFHERGTEPLSHLAGRYGRRFRQWKDNFTRDLPSLERSCVDMFEVAQSLLDRSSAEWATQLEPWDTIVERGRALFGDRLAFCLLATVAAGIRSSGETCTEFSAPLDHELSLCKRARYARLRSCTPGWWTRALDGAHTSEDRMALLMWALTWASERTLLHLADRLEQSLMDLPEHIWQRLARSLQKACSSLGRRSAGEEPGAEFAYALGNTSTRLATALSFRVDYAGSKVLYERFVAVQDVGDPVVMKFALEQALDLGHIGGADWKPDLAAVRQRVLAGATMERVWYQGVAVPLPTALAILEAPLESPALIVDEAVSSFRRYIGERIKPVGEVAKLEGWFEVDQVVRNS